MNCPYCSKSIEAMTGFQELTKFQKHLKSCKKNPKRKIISQTFVGDYGTIWTETVNATPASFKDALEIRANSNQ